MAATLRKRKPFQVIEHDHPFTVAMKEQREANGYSFQTLADMIGSGSKTYLSDIEKGKYAVSVEIGLAICQILDIPPSFCISYIYSIEQARIEKDIIQQYNAWVEYVPDTVLNNMLRTGSAKRLHETLVEG